MITVTYTAGTDPTHRTHDLVPSPDDDQYRIVKRIADIEGIDADTIDLVSVVNSEDAEPAGESPITPEEETAWKHLLDEASARALGCLAHAGSRLTQAVSFTTSNLQDVAKKDAEITSGMTSMDHNIKRAQEWAFAIRMLQQAFRVASPTTARHFADKGAAAVKSLR